MAKRQKTKTAKVVISRDQMLEDRARIARLMPFGFPLDATPGVEPPFATRYHRRVRVGPSPSDGPWNLHIDYYEGDRIFQLQSEDGEVVCDFRDSYYDNPAKAEANALLVFRLVNEHFGEAGIIDGDAFESVPESRRNYSLGNSSSKIRR